MSIQAEHVSHASVGQQGHQDQGQPYFCSEDTSYTGSETRQGGDSGNLIILCYLHTRRRCSRFAVQAVNWSKWTAIFTT